LVRKGLLVLSLLMVILGIASGYYFVTLIGALFLIASFAPSSPSRPPPTVPSSYQPRQRISPPPVATASAVAQPAPAQPPVMRFESSQSQAYVQPLFPGMMFPTLGPLTQSTGHRAEQKGEQERKAPGRDDDFLEAVGIIALLRLLSG
jgi:hypothetical protein